MISYQQSTRVRTETPKQRRECLHNQVAVILLEIGRKAHLYDEFERTLAQFRELYLGNSKGGDIFSTTTIGRPRQIRIPNSGLWNKARKRVRKKQKSKKDLDI